MSDKKITVQQKEVARQKRIQDQLMTEAQEFQKQFSKRLLDLVTGGFGLVAALAWNEVIKELISSYIQPLLGKSSGLVSLSIYALLVTFLAVFITYQLSKIVGEEKK